MPRKAKAPAATPPVVDTDASAAVKLTDLPLHSPLGASSAERWMNCPGSTALAAAIGPGQDDDGDPEYRRDGVMAHELASQCLLDDTGAYEKLDGFPALDAQGAGAIQVYLNYVRHQRANPFKGIEIIDLKFGEGIVVEPEENPQISYYGFGFLEGKVEPNAMYAAMENDYGFYVEKRVHLPEFHPLFYGTVDAAVVLLPQAHVTGDYHDDTPVRLTIVQPRVSWHPRGPIRSWETTAGALRKWAYEKLRPAMEVAQVTMDFELGEWCRFCPAKLLCPLMRETVTEVIEAADRSQPDDRAVTVDNMTQEQLAHYRGRKEAINHFYKALDARIYRLLSNGQGEPVLREVVKLVDKITYRVWKDGSEKAVVKKIGKANAYTKPELISPAEAEKLGPAGKEAVAEYAYIPKASGTTLAPASDSRREIEVKPIEQRYAVVTQDVLW